ncbi:hypothetical protein LA080_011886 [Diaporthe eres]|nr:hypothetical protein LA080_011886 [Diaporthe eres]
MTAPSMPSEIPYLTQSRDCVVPLVAFATSDFTRLTSSEVVRREARRLSATIPEAGKQPGELRNVSSQFRAGGRAPGWAGAKTENLSAPVPVVLKRMNADFADAGRSIQV